MGAKLANLQNLQPPHTHARAYAREEKTETKPALRCTIQTVSRITCMARVYCKHGSRAVQVILTGFACHTRRLCSPNLWAFLSQPDSIACRNRRHCLSYPAGLLVASANYRCDVENKKRIIKNENGMKVWGIERSVFSVIGENSRNALKIKWFSCA